MPRRKSVISMALVLILAFAMTGSIYALPSDNALSGTDYSVGDKVEVGSIRYAHAEKATAAVENQFTLDEFEKKLENNTIEIWFHQDTAGLRIVDKRSGYIWGCSDTTKPDGLNKKWYAFASSLCSIEYYDEDHNEKRVSLSSPEANPEYSWNSTGLTVNAAFPSLGISFTLHLKLTENGFRIDVPEDTITETDSFRLKSMYFLPFLGSVREDAVDGYMFLPDGPGALVRYQKAIEYSSAFAKRVYGPDYGIDNIASPSGLQSSSRSDDYIVDEPQITVPVFGVVHGAKQNAIMSVADSGMEYMTLEAQVAGAVTDFNWVSARFDFRQSYMQPIDKAGTGVYRPQTERNSMSPGQEYIFLTGESADYAGMAVAFRDWLEGRNILKSGTGNSVIPLRLSVLGAEIKKGFLWDPTIVLSDFNKAEDIVSDLRKLGVENLTMIYEGWQKGGINGSRYGETRVESKLGGRQELESLRQLVEENGRFYLETSLLSGNERQISKNKQASVNRSKAFTKLTRSNSNLMFQDTYLTRPSTALQTLNAYKESLAGFNLYDKNLGQYLYADYTRGNTTTRVETAEMFQKAIQEASLTAASNPNMLYWEYIDMIFDMPVTSSQYLFETDMVPFLPIVLKGSVDLYSPDINIGRFSENSILRMIEYGLYPSFIVTAAESYDLSDTPQADLFSVNYNDWRDQIVEIYNLMNEPLRETEGAKIIGHQVLEDGLVRVRYNNGVTIYVNYLSEEKQPDGVAVPAKGVKVIHE